jgi:uncharacterized membrane protein YjdF
MQALWLTLFLAVLIWSGIQPKDYFTWVLEVAPALIGLVVLAFTRRSFPLYVWDTQSDMALAFLGAVVGLLLLARLHDRQLNDPAGI